MKFVILTTVSPKKGYGHLNRCIILGKEIKKRGHKINLFVAGKVKDANFFCDFNWVKFTNNRIKKFPIANVCIVDKYEYKNQYYKKLRKFYKNILIFDDCKYIIPNYVSGVINPNLYANMNSYSPGIKVFSGKKYILVRNEFFKNQQKKNANRIILCVGGSDPENQMNRLISILTKVSKRPIDAVYGPGFKNLSVIERWKNHPKVFTHIAVKNISTIMSQALYAVTASGSMIYELSTVGVPTVCMALSNNQKLIGEYFSNSNLISYLGPFNEISDQKLKDKLKSFEKRIQIKNKIQKRKIFINPNGVKNLVKDLENWIHLKQSQFKSPYTKQEIQLEYDLSAKMEKEHDKVHWGSKESMYNRYNFVKNELPFSRSQDWLDVGSGTGSFQSLILKDFPKIKAVGLELSRELIKIARKKKISNVKFKQIDFIDYKGKKSDLLTCLGVMSKTNFGLNDFFIHASKLIKKNGLVMVDFTNNEWSKFRKNNFFPDARHLWFTRKQILQCLKKNKLFKIEKLIGHQPKKNKLINTSNSHVIFLKIRRINNRLI